MGLRQAWVAECDASCQAKLVITWCDSRQARQAALDNGWETVLRADPDGTSVVWLCSRHRYALPPEPEHEDWCPRKVRGDSCACLVSAEIRTHTTDQAEAEVPWRRGIDDVRPDGEIL